MSGGRNAAYPGFVNAGTVGKIPMGPPASRPTPVIQQTKILDVDAFQKQVLEQTTKEFQVPVVKSSVIVLGKDKRTDARNQLVFPELRYIQLLKDGIDNIFTELQWRMNRLNVESGNIIGFNIYRKRYTTEEIKNDPDFGFLIFNSFDSRSFARVSNKIVNKGTFSEDKKAIPFIKRGDIDPKILNNNLINDIARNSLANSTVATYGEIESILTSAKFEKLAYVDYTNFIMQAQRKFVFVKERDFVDLTYIDKKVGYNEVFEYYITSVTKDAQESVPSNSIKLFIQDPSPVAPPTNVIIKQLNVTTNTINITIDPRSYTSKIVIFRKAEDDTKFSLLTEIDNVSDSVSFYDDTIIFYKTYTYRVFAQNIFGFFSEPKEATVFASIKHVTPQSRFNTFKIPIVSVVQDQNSKYAKITISPNDPALSYYEIKRRDLTIKERKFSVPTKDETNYGGAGWETNKFFIKKRNVTEQNSNIVLRTVMDEIIFIDDTVDKDHIYQYQVRGYDLKGNATSYQLASVKIDLAPAARTPIDLKYTILRQHPLRIKISWVDDSLNTDNSRVLYRLQRRKKDSTIYESFPVTENNFVIDEVACDDYVVFSTNKIQDIYEPLEDKEGDFSKVPRQSFMPPFLQPNDVYYYRVAIIKQLDTSVATPIVRTVGATGRVAFNVASEI